MIKTYSAEGGGPGCCYKGIIASTGRQTRGFDWRFRLPRAADVCIENENFARATRVSCY